MNDLLRSVVREHHAAVAALPSDDPLRRLLAEQTSGLDMDEMARLDDEAALLQDRLAQVEVPELESRLLAIGRPRSSDRRPLVLVLALAAALALAFGLGAWFGRGLASPAAIPGLLVAAPPETPAAPPSPIEGPRVIAVKFWHVTCPACKTLDPRYADVIDNSGPEGREEYFDDSEVLFVTLDMSTALSRQQAALLASALGVRDVYDEVFGSSGFVVLFDARTKQRLGRLTAVQETNEMRSSIRDAISRARS